MSSAGLNDSNRGNASDFIGQCTVTRSCEPCMKAHTSKTATIFCQDCQEFLCETCRNPHIAYKSGRHDIEIIQERESSQVVVDMKGMDMCKEHGRPFEFFCEDHSKLCCPTCVFTHRRCDKLDEISSNSLQERAELDNWKQCLLMLASDADANEIACKLSEKQLNESIKDIYKEVDDLADRLIIQIEEAKRDCLTQANALKCEEVKRLNDRHDLNTKVKDEICETLQFFFAISKQGTFQQKYIFLKQIEEKCKKIESKINEQRTTQVSSKVTLSYSRELSSLLEMGNTFLKVNLERTGKWRNTVDVTVKTFNPGKMTPEALDEAKLMHYLRHQNLVQLMAVCTKSEPIWIITERLVNGTLLDYLRKDKGRIITFNIIAGMAGQIADGMAYLEAENCVHCDLRAANILVGEHHEVKVADFGNARIIKEDIYETPKNTNFLIKWTAPEAAFECKFSIKSDVWSYGVVLYELITFGLVPYPGMQSHEVLNKVKKGFRMPRPTGGPVPCPDSYYEHMLKCWYQSPETRPTFAYLQDFFNNYMVPAERKYEPILTQSTLL